MNKIEKEIMELKEIFPIAIIEMLKKLFIAAGVITLLVLSFFGFHTGASIFLGALCVIIGIVVSVPIAYKNKNTPKASRIIIDALKAEAVKILIIVILLWAIFKLYEELEPIAIILGIAIAAIFSGIAISKTK